MMRELGKAAMKLMHRMVTRRRWLLWALGSVSLGGCNWLNNLRNATDNPVKLEPRPAKDFVGYLNRQSSYLDSLRYDSVRLSAAIPNQPIVPTLTSGLIVCSKPLNFRLQAGLPIGGDQVDVGSNAREFWMFVKQSDPKYLFCSHADFPKVQDRLPVPFEPEGVMQALGMTSLPETRNYQIEISEKRGVYYLSWEDITASGQRVMKVVEFAGERASATTPQVRRHLLLTPTKNGDWETAALAEIKKVVTREVSRDHSGNQPGYVQVPTHLVLEWPTQKVKLELHLDRVKINEPISRQDQLAFFEKPAKLDNASPVNLADFRFNAGPSGRGRPSSDLPDVDYRR